MTTRVTVPASGAVYTVPFPYLDKAHVKVNVGGTLTTAFTWETAGSIRLTTIPTTGNVEIYRKTPAVPLVDFQNGAVLTESDLDTANKQSLYLAEEVDEALTNAKVVSGTVTSVAGKTGPVLLVKADVGLGVVDNTADIDKPVSTPQAAANTADRARANHTGTQPVSTITGLAAVATSGLKADVGLGNVDNTADSAKPVSGPQQTALNAKAPNRNAVVHVVDHGATGVVGVDATSAFNAAIAALPASGGVIDIDPAGSYMITTPVIYNKPVLWRCQRGRSDITTNTNGGDAEKPLIYWGGTSNTGAILTQKPAAVGTCLYGGGCEGIHFDGQALIATGLHLDCNRYGVVEGKARNFTSEGLLISSMSGTAGIFSKKVRVKDWDYIYGTSVACKDSHGIRIKGNGTTVPSTQMLVDRVFALIKHGSALRIEETDNCQIGSAQAVGDGGTGGGGGASTGCTAWLAAAGSTVSYNNHFDYVSGEIRHESGAFGTTVNHFTAEGGLIKQVAGTPSWHGRIVEASGANGAARSDAFISHQYPLRKVLEIPAFAMVPTGTGAALLAGIYNCVTLREGQGDVLTYAVPISADLSDGVIEDVTILHGTNTASAGNYVMTCHLTSVAKNSVVTGTEYVLAITAAAANTVAETSLPFGGPVSHTKGNIIFVRISRASLHASDTATTDMCIVGVRIKFRSKGPTVYDVAGIPAASVPTWNMP